MMSFAAPHRGMGFVVDEPNFPADTRSVDLPMRLKTSRVAGPFRWGVALLAALWVPSVAFAQNCALCYTQAAAASSRLIEALRSGILILVIPPMLICVGITVMAYRKRNQFNEE